MEDSNATITLIGTKLAKVGNDFIFRGKSKDCEPCKFKKTCLNLNTETRYRIVKIRNTDKLECFVHDSGVCAIEVIEAPIRMSVESRKAIKGSRIIYDSLSCDIEECEYYELCHPPGLKEGEKFTILDVEDEIIESCEKNNILKIVDVAR